MPSGFWSQPGDGIWAQSALRWDPVTGTYTRVGKTETVTAAEVAARKLADEQLATHIAAERENERGRSKGEEPILHDPATNAFFRVTPQGMEQISAEEAAGKTPTDFVAEGPTPDRPERQPEPVRVDPGSGARYEANLTGHVEPLPDDGRQARSSSFLAQVEQRRRRDGVPLTEVPHLPEKVSRRDLELAV